MRHSQGLRNLKVNNLEILNYNIWWLSGCILTLFIYNNIQGEKLSFQMQYLHSMRAELNSIFVFVEKLNYILY